MNWRIGAAALVGAAVVLIGSVPAQAQSPTVSEILRPISARELGPTSMGGRISELAVYEKEPRIFYAASASGGLWKTTDGGMTFTPQFQYESTVALGAVTVDQSNPDIVWIGTGEQNSRNSSSWGGGVFKSSDGGETWTNVGLKETKHISTILLNPKDKNTVYVGALGHLWGANKERGLYKTTDGGKTWENILYVNDKTGVIDMVMDPRDPNTIIVAMWERFRWPYRWASGGEGSGIYKTTDGGKKWTKITKGVPTGDLGRIGLDIYLKNPDVLVATIEAGDKMGGFFKSKDGGNSWERLSNENPRPFYFSIPRIDPTDENRVYIPGVSVRYSDDGGKNFQNLQSSVHVDHHAWWINPNDGNHMIIGEDGGVAQTRNAHDRKNIKWEHLNYLRLGQFYALGVDMRKPYWVYGGLQDNGTWGGPSQSIKGGVTNFDWRFINGGDGFHVQVDPTDWRIVYAESQGGAVVRHNIETGERQFIRPRPPRPAEGEQAEQYRFNWSAPIVISPHNPHTIWFGGNKLFKSIDRGDNWTVVSDDLSTNDPSKLDPRGGVTPENTGAEVHCTIITISESPMKAGVVWVGTDDGLVHVTKDDGRTWENVTANIPDLPKNTWVSRVAASRHVLGRAYATFDGHRNNDYNPYVYVTEDYGQTWKPIKSGLGMDDSCYVIVEGHRNPDFLALGTELGLYISLDRGQSWTKFHKDNGFPTVRVDDLVIHPRELDLVVGTHGRSIWIIPAKPLELLSTSKRDDAVVLLEPGNMYGLGRVFGGWYEGDRQWMSPNTQPGGEVFYYMKEGQEAKVKVEFFAADGQSLGSIDGEAKKGLNSVTWRPRTRTPLETGSYRVVLTVGDKTYTTSIRYEDLAGTLDH